MSLRGPADRRACSWCRSSSSPWPSSSPAPPRPTSSTASTSNWCPAGPQLPPRRRDRRRGVGQRPRSVRPRCTRRASRTARSVSCPSPNVNRRRAGAPKVTVAQAVAAARAGDAFTVSSTSGSGRYRVLATRVPDGAVDLVGLSLHDVDATMGRLRWVLIAAIAIVIGILGVVVFWVLRLGVRPLKRMTRTAGAIAAGDLSQRVPAEADGHRGARARRRAQRHAHDHRGRVRRAGRERGPPAPLRRRRVARAAHPGHHHPRLRRAVPARGPVRTRRPRPGHASHRAGVGAHGVAGRRPAAAGAARRGSPARAGARRPRRARHRRRRRRACGGARSGRHRRGGRRRDRRGRRGPAAPGRGQPGRQRARCTRRRGHRCRSGSTTAAGGRWSRSTTTVRA